MKKKMTKSRVLLLILSIIGILAAISAVMVFSLLLYDQIKAGQEAEEAMAEPQTVSDMEEEWNRQLSEMAEQMKTEATEEVLAELKQSLSEGMSTVEALRPFYPNEIVVVSNGVFHFVPIREELAKHPYKQENLQVEENGEFQYLEGETVISHKGIDVSKFQGEIDWKKVKEDGVEFAFLRVGFRGYGSGEIVLDETFHKNAENALAAGVQIGAYFFSQAVTEAEAVEEAQFVLEQIAPYHITYPVVFDVEKVSDKSGRMNQISVEERTHITAVFCETMKEAGYAPMIYGNMEMFSVLLDLEPLEQYDKWYAYYDPTLYYPYDYKIWQYSEKGRVAGIKEPVDLNISFQTWGEE